MQNVTRDEIVHAIEQAGAQVVERANAANGEEWFLDRSPCCQASEQYKRGERKMMMNAGTGLWNCARCGTGGNLFQYRRLTGQLEMFVPASQARGGTFSSGTRRGDELARAEQAEMASKREKIIPVKLVEAMERALWADTDLGREALAYLRTGRGFSDETIKRFRFGWSQSCYFRCACGNEEKRRGPGELGAVECRKCHAQIGEAHTRVPLVAIPIFENGRCVLVKYRGVREKCFEREFGCKSPLFGIDDLKPKPGAKQSWRRVAITEAELDRVSLEQYGVVEGPVLSLTAGAKGTQEAMLTAIGPYRQDLAAFDEVLLAMDNDEAGDLCADACADVLGRHRCFRLKLPMKDANDCLRSGIKPDAIKARIEEATSYSVNAVRHVSAYRDALKMRFKVDGASAAYKTGWDSIDRLWGGVRGGEMTVITGDTGSGKSMFTKRLTLNLAQQLKDDGRAALLASLEDGVKATVRILTAMTGRKLVDTMTEDEALRTYDELVATLPLYMVGEWTDQSRFDDLLANIEWGVRRYGLWLVVLDHFHWVLDSSESGDGERFQVERAVRKLKTLVDRTGIHLILVVHPAKLRTTNRGQIVEPDLNDLKGSSEIKKAAFTAFRVWRDRTASRAESDKRARALITTLKVRFEGGQEGSVPMWYDTKALDYIPLSREELEAGKRGNGKKQEAPAPSGRVDLDGKDDGDDLPF